MKSFSAPNKYVRYNRFSFHAHLQRFRREFLHARISVVGRILHIRWRGVSSGWSIWMRLYKGRERAAGRRLRAIVAMYESLMTGDESPIRSYPLGINRFS